MESDFLSAIRPRLFGVGEFFCSKSIFVTETAFLNADKHSPASRARSTKRRGDASVSGGFQLALTDREATAFMSK